MKQRDEKKTFSGHKEERPFRCLCGSLLARLVPQGVELKCRRCKRHIIVPLESETPEVESQM
ncbi:MAG: hypothetical protein E6J89_05715 [Deltaproteobacteria bacterium]|nr:MAG: hypothetical protein E6J89_05715 [Deltaproteobacteria bacterium]